MTTQDIVKQAIALRGGLWPIKDIQLKLTEELGELVQAIRKKDRKEQASELGDVGVALYCLAESLHMSLDLAIQQSLQTNASKPISQSH